MTETDYFQVRWRETDQVGETKMFVRHQPEVLPSKE
jgi:hypothetical protein